MELTEKAATLEKIYYFQPVNINHKKHKDASKFSRIKKKLWSVLPSLASTLLALTYGLMLGWPSANYPKLLSTSSDVPITLDQSAMIAGFLMLSTTISTPFSTSEVLPPKSGIVLGSALITLSWAVMWYASNLYWILGSRLLAGIGYGYGVGQARRYISDICAPDLKPTLLKTVTVYQFLGIVAGNALGYVDFRTFSVVALGVSVIVLFVCMVLPSTPKELVKHEKLRDARRLMQFLYGRRVNYVEEIQNIKFELAKKQNVKSLAHVIRTKELRKPFGVFSALLVLQQISGAPSTFIYTQFIFIRTDSVAPKICAIVYVVVFFVASVLGTFYITHVNKKLLLLTSSVLTNVFLLTNCLILYFKLNTFVCPYIFPLSMFLYIFSYTIGWGSVPVSLIEEYFPINCRPRLAQYFLMLHCMFALIITKIFQMLMQNFDLYVPFCMYLGISFLGLVFVIFCMPCDGFVKKNVTALFGNKENS